MQTRRITRSQVYAIAGLIGLLVITIVNRVYATQFRVSTPMARVVPAGFVTRAGSQLLLNGRPFRFAGANMHWLALDDSRNYPSQFRVNDGLDAAREMGLTVIRSHDLGISTGCPNCIEPSLGVFNATALAHDDYVIKAARDRGMRLIIPFTDNWRFPAGGKHNFTDWRGISDENQFYFNEQVINDFETYIRTLLTHVNIYTGVAYKDDPTIMAWETANEIEAPTNWTRTISSYIKSIDARHLVVDGRVGVDPNSANLPDVDIVSDHYYPRSISQLRLDASAAQLAGKAFIVGEFDWNDANGGDSLRSFLSAVESNPIVAGDAFWELWSHADEYGYVKGGDKAYTLYYPGDSPAMRESVQLLRTHAYALRNEAVPPASIPGSPSMNVVVRGGPHDVLVWRGTALAASYTIERSTSGDQGPWTVICDKCATDMSTPWTDTTTPIGALWYRVTANNLAGAAGPPSSPYQAGTPDGIIVDNLDDLSHAEEYSNNISLDKSKAEKTHGDTSRAIRSTATHEYIIWKQDGMRSFQAIAYFWSGEPMSHFSFYTSSDNRNWVLSHPTISILGGNWIECVYTLNDLSNVNYVKLVWNNTRGQPWNPNLGEISIIY